MRGELNTFAKEIQMEDKYNLKPALNKAFDIANSRASRDGSMTLPWAEPTAAVLIAYFKLGRCVSRRLNADGDVAGYEVDLRQFAKEAPDLIAYMARAYGMHINPDCRTELTADSAEAAEKMPEIDDPRFGVDIRNVQQVAWDGTPLNGMHIDPEESGDEAVSLSPLAELRAAANNVVEALIAFRTNPAGQAAAMEELGDAIMAMDELLPKHPESEA